MGTSIPKRSNEMKGTPPSPITKYTLSPEELAEIQGKPIPKSHKKPIGFQTKTNVPKIKEAVKDMPKVNKEEYFSLRAQGSSRKEAAKKLGTSKQSLETYWFGKWGIKNDAGEEVEIARFKESRRESKEEAPAPEPQVQVIEMQERAQPQMIDFEVTISGEPSRDEVPTLPVRLTQEQADALILIMKHKPADEIVLSHSATFILAQNRWKDKLGPLNDLSMDDMIRAIYFGYEIVRTPEEQLLQEFEQAEARYGADSVPFKTGLQIAAEILGYKVAGVNA
ncbi:hypothetical protein ABES58_04410 [Paenibacillus lautus]|uniref:hypothetical protein n=1 Tax=Paenibacillus lautus TaxID=1401 RepID=UPI003D2B4337